MRKKRTYDKHRCDIFHCDKRGDRYCCFFCNNKEKCKNPCMNNPEKCGKAFIKEE